MKPISYRKTFSFTLVIFLLLALNVLLFLISLSIGRFNVPFIEVVKLMLGKVFHLIKPIDSTYDTIVFSIRLPRILAAMLIGAALSQSGAAYQGLFNNPLVDPYILGLSAGAGFGAAIAILMNGNYLIIELFAFTFSLLAVFLTSTISRSSKSTVTMVLSGFIVSSLFTSLISFLKYYADPYTKLPSIVYWLMGTFSQVSTKEIGFIAPIMLVSMIALYLLRWKLNILSLGTEEALSLGENPAKLRFIIVVISTVLTSLSVSISGIIGWVGLVIPHLGRMLVGPDYRKLLPTTILLGSSYLLIIDNLSRSISASEIPIGILTALIGAPFFIYLMRFTRYRWE